MTMWVAGLLTDGNRVAFIKKTHPAWQKGKYNLIGGKIEDGESSDQAMVREFEEETGVRVDDWNLFLTLSFEGGAVCFYRARVDTATLRSVRSVTDEQVHVLSLSNLIDLPHIPNLNWIVPLGMHLHDAYETVHVAEIFNA